jgi:uncharacterized delta-60 repeat protein
MGQADVTRGRRFARSLRWAAIAATLLAALSLPTSAQAHSAQDGAGALDPSFGQAGRVATAADLGGNWRVAPIELATAPDRSTVLASPRQLFRYLPDGSLDRSFGEGGQLTLDGVEGLPFRLSGVAVDRSGRIVAFGTATDPQTFTIPAYGGGQFVHPSYAVVLRFEPNGALDPRFGRAGIARTQFNLPPNLQPEGGAPSYSAVAVVSGQLDGQGRPLMVVARRELLENERGGSTVRPVSRLVARLTASGEVDSSFGDGDGVAELPTSNDLGLISGAAGRPVFASTQSAPARIARLTGHGTIASSFGNDGVAAVGGAAYGMVLDHSGRLLMLTQSASGRPQITRLLPDGSPDPSFGHGGHLRLSPPGGGLLSGIAVDSRNRIIVVGTAPGGVGEGVNGPARYLLAARLSARGGLDRGFARRGWIRTGFGRRTKIETAGEAVVSRQDSVVPSLQVVGPRVGLDSEGRLVIAVPAHSPRLQPGGIVLARYDLGS